MVVIVANDLPPAARGKLKLWFIEPKPNVFVSGVNDALADRVVELVLSYCPAESGMVVFKSLRRPPGYSIYARGEPAKSLSVLTGLQVVRDRAGNDEESSPGGVPSP